MFKRNYRVRTKIDLPDENFIREILPKNSTGTVLGNADMSGDLLLIKLDNFDKAKIINACDLEKVGSD